MERKTGLTTCIPTRLLSVDPSTRATGYCILQRTENGMVHYVASGCIKFASKKYEAFERSLLTADTLVDLAVKNLITDVAIEKMVIRMDARGYAALTTGGVIRLFEEVAMLYSLLVTSTHLPITAANVGLLTPKVWKNAVPKDVNHRRIAKHLDLADSAVRGLSGSKFLQCGEDERDAIGIGLFVCQRHLPTLFRADEICNGLIR